MKRGDYVLCNGTTWRVIKKHESGTIQIQTLQVLPSWIHDMEVKPEDVEVITKEVADVIRSSYEER